jgi:hypothetical protein
MAVTKREYNLSAYWNSNELLDILETALADIGFHAATQTGTILTFTNTSGTTITGQKGKRYLVAQSSTSGSGQYATFDIIRNAATGAIATVTLVNGGKGYAATNTITIAGADIGGSTPTDNLTITVSTVSGNQGSTTTWYDKDTASPYTWGVCCVDIDETKKMGQTYYSFHIPANPGLAPTLHIKSGPGFQSSTNVFNGVSILDFINNGPNSTSTQFSQVIARTNATPLRLVTFQSGIDPDFVVFQFSDVEKYGDVFRDPFILSNYNTLTQPWSLDDCFTGGIYTINKALANTADTNVSTSLVGLSLPKRCGEWGYAGWSVGTTGARSIIGAYESIFGRRMLTGTTAITTQFPVIYQRSLNDLVHESLEYNPVITGIPICNIMVPVPYYIPADFGVTEVIGTNTIAHRDLIKVGSTTEWRVLQYANNMNAATYNTAIAFVCKVTD